jgi:hypothetical protein
MKSDDPAIHHIREVRHQISAEFGHDPKKLLDHYAELEKKLLAQRKSKERVDSKRAPQAE